MWGPVSIGMSPHLEDGVGGKLGMTGAVDRYNGQEKCALITTHPIANRIVDGVVQTPSFAMRIDIVFCVVIEVGIRRATDLTLAEVGAFRTKQHFWRLMTTPCFLYPILTTRGMRRDVSRVMKVANQLHKRLCAGRLARTG